MRSKQFNTIMSPIAVLSACLVAQAALAHPGGGILRLDADGDDKVSFEEFLPQEREGRRGRLFDRADLDGDSVVSRDEMLEAIGEISEERSQEALQRFDETDLDGNGEVSQEESRMKRFGHLDQDGDGFLTAEEIDAMHAQRRGGRRHGERRS